MTRALGYPFSNIYRIWQAFGLHLHRSKTCKLAAYRFFAEKIRVIDGLHLDPAGRALVLSIYENNHIQAIDRAQPLLQMRPGKAERHTRAHKWHGTMSLFAVLDIAYKKMTIRRFIQHIARRFLLFLRETDANVPYGLEAYLVIENYDTQRALIIRKWLYERPGRHVHRSTKRFEQAIQDHIDTVNNGLKPIPQTRSANQILASIKRSARQPLKQRKRKPNELRDQDTSGT